MRVRVRVRVRVHVRVPMYVQQALRLRVNLCQQNPQSSGGARCGLQEGPVVCLPEGTACKTRCLFCRARVFIRGLECSKMVVLQVFLRRDAVAPLHVCARLAHAGLWASPC